MTTDHIFQDKYQPIKVDTQPIRSPLEGKPNRRCDEETIKTEARAFQKQTTQEKAKAT